MTLARPGDLEELRRLLAGRGEPLPVVTGADREPAPEARRELEAEGLALVSTAALTGIVSHRPGDFVVTARAGTTLDALAQTLADEGQWIPPATPGRVDRLPGTVGGLVAAAPAGPFDLGHGPLRRHLLACRVVTGDGTLYRWGRPVMKDVAGYALQTLCAGSHGTLGAVVEASLRTWPLPAADETWELATADAPERPGGEGAAGGRPGAFAAGALEVAAALTAAPADAPPMPDAVTWTWRADGPPGGRLECRLTGTGEAVAARRRRLLAWAEARGVASRRAESPADQGGAARGSAGPHGGSGAEGRHPRRVVLRITGRPRDLPMLARRVLGAFPGSGGAAEALPLVGALRVAWDREPGPEGERTASAVIAAAGRARVAVERGGPHEHAATAARRDPRAAAFEERLVRALGGGPRAWVADYV